MKKVKYADLQVTCSPVNPHSVRVQVNSSVRLECPIFPWKLDTPSTGRVRNLGVRGDFELGMRGDFTSDGADPTKRDMEC